MKASAGPSSSSSRLHEALLEYFGAPGKYQLSLREPALLFASVREILQVAAGRGAGAQHGEELRQAAVFFIRAALLYPGADHYAVLGYPARAAAADLKERYRLLMRLTHPDFAAAGSAPWPADAAVRVNRAYEVLSSPVLRREYDEQLGASRAAPKAAPGTAAGVRAVPAVRRAEPARSATGKRWVAAVAVVLGASGIALLVPRSEPDALVQRAPAPRPGERQAQAQAESAAAALPAALVSSEGLARPAAPSAPAEIAEAPPSTPTPLPEAPVAQAAPPALPAPAPAPAPASAAPRHSDPAPLAAALAPRGALRDLHPPSVARSGVARVPPERPEPTPDTPIREWHEALPALEVAGPTSAPPAEPAVMQAAAVMAPPAVSQPMAVPIPLAAAPGAPASAVVATRAVVPPPAVLPVAISIAPAPTLADAQPVLTQLLHMMESGNGEQLLHLLDAKARQSPGARGLSRQFDRVAEAGRPVHVSQVEFLGEVREGVLLVTGRMRLHAGEPTIGARGQKFVVHAEFVTRGGKTTLTGLSGAAE